MTKSQRSLAPLASAQHLLPERLQPWSFSFPLGRDIPRNKSMVNAVQPRTLTAHAHLE